MKILEAPFEVKATGKAGEFEGYGSVFNNVDLGNDVIAEGAFEKVKTTSDGKLRIALYHDLSRLVGKAEYSQDSHGLHVRGKINMNVSYAKDTYELMKDGTLDGMSVGFNILPDGGEMKKIGDDHVFYITKAELWEVSIVPFGMNPEAKIESVKELQGVDVRALEKSFRDNGLSKREAVIAVSIFKEGLNSRGSQSDSGKPAIEMMAEVNEAIKHFKI